MHFAGGEISFHNFPSGRLEATLKFLLYAVSRIVLRLPTELRLNLCHLLGLANFIASESRVSDVGSQQLPVSEFQPLLGNLIFQGYLWCKSQVVPEEFCPPDQGPDREGTARNDFFTIDHSSSFFIMKPRSNSL